MMTRKSFLGFVAVGVSLFSLVSPALYSQTTASSQDQATAPATKPGTTATINSASTSRASAASSGTSATAVTAKSDPGARTSTSTTSTNTTATNTTATSAAATSAAGTKTNCTATAAGPPLPPTKPQEQIPDPLARARGAHATLVSAVDQSGAQPSVHSTTSATVSQTPPQPGMVWANPNSKVYHQPASRWYGKTKDGQWMTEQEAIKAGYHAAKQ
ncbi:hypothetical protein HNQ77_003801 [Silvibacterium bohemicum]|uniref:Uncharacterized protein n=1 Tax=Silvibacterium bohemicum TaxID=1577686 RepID=A0A841K3U4_9BACT|nr:hypothetical protein [Silvibacterium bohemicum]MBB6145831.1 hypothetical protein [Silvibacterium bohemicum]